MIAKIGYAAAIAHYGLDPIEPYVVNAILGETRDIGKWVGCDANKLIKDRGHGHTVAMLRADNENSRDRAFDFIDAAEYRVIIGRLKGDSGEGHK